MEIEKNGYHVAVWNCRRGLIDKDGNPTSKFTDIQLCIQKHNLDAFGIIESDLYGLSSNNIRRTKKYLLVALVQVTFKKP